MLGVLLAHVSLTSCPHGLLSQVPSPGLTSQDLPAALPKSLVLFDYSESPLTSVFFDLPATTAHVTQPAFTSSGLVYPQAGDVHGHRCRPLVSLLTSQHSLCPGPERLAQPGASEHARDGELETEQEAAASWGLCSAAGSHGSEEGTGNAGQQSWGSSWPFFVLWTC